MRLLAPLKVLVNWELPDVQAGFWRGRGTREQIANICWIMKKASGGFPGSSVGKESPCNAGDPGSVPGTGRSTGEGIGYPLQYSWASLVAQLVKNPPAMWETWVWPLDWEDPLERGTATLSNILAWRIPWTIQSMGSQRLRHDWVNFTFQKNVCFIDYANVFWLCESQQTVENS